MSKIYGFVRSNVVVAEYYIEADDYEEALQTLSCALPEDYKIIYEGCEDIECIQNPDELGKEEEEFLEGQ